MSEHLVKKYDLIAEGFAERTYENLHFDMYRRFIIATTWGAPLPPGDSVLELGCGDGYLAQLFVQQGLRYRGVDISPKMVTMAEQRLREAKLKAEFVVTDVSQMPLSEPFDVVMSFMGAFFTYVSSPLAVLTRFRPYVRRKIVLDLNPRGNIPLRAAIEMLRKAGFRNIAWRPFFVPSAKKWPTSMLKMLVICESIPVLRSFPLRRKFLCLLKGEADLGDL
jgi:ubiquinone/menaquinone biosynthesis C-methylase UbiE